MKESILYFVLLCFPSSVILQEKRVRSSRFLPWFSNGGQKKAIETSPDLLTTTEFCHEAGRKFVEGKCYKLVKNLATFSDARAICSKTNGDLWIPDTSDPYLLTSFMKHLPDLFALSTDAVWIGVQTDGSRTVSTIQGKDVTKDPWLNIGRTHLRASKDPKCVTLQFQFGTMIPVGHGCDNETFPFICEFTEHDWAIKDL